MTRLYRLTLLLTVLVGVALLGLVTLRVRANSFDGKFERIEVGMNIR